MRKHRQPASDLDFTVLSDLEQLTVRNLYESGFVVIPAPLLRAHQHLCYKGWCQAIWKYKDRYRLELTEEGRKAYKP